MLWSKNVIKQTQGESIKKVVRKKRLSFAGEVAKTRNGKLSRRIILGTLSRGGKPGVRQVKEDLAAMPIGSPAGFSNHQRLDGRHPVNIWSQHSDLVDGCNATGQVTQRVSRKDGEVRGGTAQIAKRRRGVRAM